MRSRLVLILLLVATSVLIVAPAAAASSEGLVLAQDTGEEPQVEGGEGQDEGGAGQDDPEAESGANQGQTEEVEETGPPWTYQMAWITLALLLFLGIGLVVLYYRLVAQRRKGEV